MQINRAFSQFVPVVVATLALSACDEPAPRAANRPSTPQYANVQPVLPPAAPRPQPRPYTPPTYTAPAPAPTYGRPQTPYAPATTTDWRDAPLPAGDWAWTARAGGSEARYGPGGSPPIAIMVCDRAAGVVRIALALPSMASVGQQTSATITTSTATNSFVASPQGIDALQTLAITLPVSNRMLDAMAYSRGRFRIEIGGMAPVVLPSWSEVGRVVEDCRSLG